MRQEDVDKKETKEESNDQDNVAIIGISCRFPDANNYNEFWTNLINSKNSIREITPDHWDIKKHYSADPKEENKSISKWGGLINDIHSFDAPFFHISAREAKAMDPQQRLLLEETWHCIEDSGISLNHLQKEKTSVYIGVMATDYISRILETRIPIDAYYGIGNYEGILANRLSYTFNLTGTSYSIDNACASSLVALHLAKSSILHNETDFALVGGVNIICHPWKYISFSKAHMLSPDGQCKTFDTHANGYVPGEGIGMVLLCSLKKAIKNNYHIYGIIKGSAVRHSGKTITITAPSVKMQKNVIKDAINDAVIDSESISYIEAHGTGTSLGDPIEIEALKQAFNTTKQQFCHIGSVKTNIGHLEGAAGIASVIKVLLMFAHQKIPKTLNIESINPIIDFQHSPFQVAMQTCDWKTSVRRAGVSSFGFGGISSHVILEEYTTTKSKNKINNAALPFVLSTKSIKSLNKLLTTWKEFITTAKFNNLSLAEICATLLNGRENYNHRFAKRVDSKEDIIKFVRAYIDTDDTNVKNRHSSHFVLLCDDISFDSIKFDSLITKYPALYSIRKDIFEEITQLDSQNKSIGISQALEKQLPDLMNFINNYVLSKAINKLVTLDFVAGNQFGNLTALVITNVISLQDAILIILNKQVDKDKFERPQLTFYDSTKQKFLMQFLIDEQYCQSLMNSLVVDPEAKATIFNQSKQLIHNQLTFIKYVQEWEKTLQKYDIDLNAVLKDSEGKTPAHDLVFIILYISLLKLYKKWVLPNNVTIHNDALLEFTDLVLDDVLSIPMAAELVLKRSSDAYHHAASHIKKKLKHLDVEKPYPILKKNNHFLNEITASKEWIRELLSTRIDLESLPVAEQPIIFLSVGDANRKNAFNLRLHDFDRSLTDLLVNLWQHGVNIDWSQWYPLLGQQHQALPLYPFDKIHYWEEDEPVKTSNYEQSSKTNTSKIPHISPSESGSTSSDTESVTLINKVNETLCEMTSKILQLPTSDIDIEEQLSKYGMDSVNLTEFSIMLDDYYAIELSPAILFEYPTLKLLSDYLLSVYLPQIEKKYNYSTEKCNQISKESKNQTHHEILIEPNHKFKKQSYKDIAIIGMGGIFPGAKTLTEFWQNMVAGKDSIIEIPEQRWKWQEYFGEKKLGQTKAKWGGFIDGIDEFDAQFFNISPHEAERMDPQQRILLEVVAQAIEDAGYASTTLSSMRTGVFVGQSTADYDKRLDLLHESSAHMATGNARSVLSNRVSYYFNFNGPSFTVDTACSSSLVAIHLAIKALHNGECDIAIAGGVNALITPNYYLQFSDAGMLSPDGRCKAFDKSANGYVRGEGVGALVLKPLAKAQADGDAIYGIIKGSAINHGGHVNSLTVPNPNAQAQVIMDALEEAQVDIEQITYIEAHGTGTPLGDPIEINGLKKAFNNIMEKQGKKYLPNAYCGIGTVKTNIGHLESAAGMAGIIKVLLSLKYGVLPKVLHLKTLNPYIDIQNTPFYIVDKTKPWTALIDNEEKRIIRTAGISSFGFGGANAHVVVQEAINLKFSPPTNPYYLVTVSAKTVTALERKLNELLEWAKNNKNTNVADMTYTLNVGRNDYKHRFATVIHNIDELISKLVNYNEGKTVEDVYFNLPRNKVVSEIQILDEQDEKKYHDQLLTLARHYAEGNTIKWDNIYGTNVYNRLHLPTYPFEHEKFWMTEADVKSATVKQNNTAETGLVDSFTETDNHFIFQKRLNGTEFYLQDHKVRGKPVFPAAGYIELVRQAASLMQNSGIIIIKQMIWARPLQISKEPLLTKLSITKKDNGYTFNITSIFNNKDQDHAKGKLYFTDKIDSISADIQSIKSRCQNPLTKREIYDNFNEIGLNYGPSFQVITNYWSNDNEVFAQLDLPDHLLSSINKFVIHPSLLDGAFQATFKLVENKQLYLPFSINEIQIHQPLQKRVFVHAVLLSPSQNNQAIFNIQLLDETGRVLADIKNFVMRPLPKIEESPVKAMQEKATGTINSNIPYGLFYYTPVWIRQSQTSGNNKITGPILIFDNECKVSQLLQQNFSPSKVYRVKEDAQFQQIDEFTFAMNMNNHNDYITLFTHLKNHNMVPSHILVTHHHNVEVTSDPEPYLQEYFYKTFNIVKAVGLSKPQSNIKIVDISPSLNPFNEALTGFGKTIHLENPKLSLHVLCLPNIELLFDEINTDELIIEYKDQIKLVKCYQIVPPTYQQQNKYFRQKGVYLITGGAGGLGKIFTKYLIENYDANIILIGRSPQPKNVLLNSTKITYKQVDVTNQDAIKHLISEIHQNLGPINGVIHSAGTIRDAFIAKKLTEDCKSVFTPKIKGLIALDEAMKDEPLDFFVIFSSMVSVFGNVGQCDYAYANGFIDAYADYRNQLVERQQRKGKTCAINWPLWADGGMQVDPASRRWLEKSLGATVLPTSAGINALNEALLFKHSQTIVLVGNKEKLEKSLGHVISANATREDIPVNNIDKPIVSEKDDELFAAVVNEIRHATADILKLQPSTIDLNEDLSEYGLDSIGLTDLTMTVSEIYGINLSPAVIFEHKTLKSFVEYLMKDHLNALHKKHADTKMKKENDSPISTPSIPKTQASKQQNAATDPEPQDLLNKVIATLVATTAEVLKMPPDKVDPLEQLSEYGLDSIGLTELTINLGDFYALNLTPAIAFEHKTLMSFSEFLLKEYPREIKAKHAGVVSEEAPSIQISTEPPEAQIKEDLPPTQIQAESPLKQASRPLEPPKTEQPEYAHPPTSQELKSYHKEIAVIGMVGRLPGAPDLKTFWNNLLQHKNPISEVPKDRWMWEDYYGSKDERKTKTKWGGFIDGFDEFDAEFFNISPSEAESMDVQQRLFLQACWQVIEMAGYTPEELAKTKTGIYVGVANHDYLELISPRDKFSAYYPIGNSHNILANRVSYLFNFTGPSLPVDTACSSALVALHQAVQAIQMGDCQQALAGGVSIILTPTLQIAFDQAGMLAEDGKCKTFDKAANGYVRGEGVGVILLKPLDKAIVDGDTIYGVIKGSAINHGGHVNGITVPNPNAQAEVIVTALERAGVGSETISYVEAHGTGTPLGDPIEINGLKKAFQATQHLEKPQYAYCGVGSVKTNIGHLETAAAIAGVLKVLLALQHKTIPGNIHFHELNPYIDIKNSPFYIVSESKQWTHLKDEVGNPIPLRAGVSSFGFGGSNGHVIIEEAPQITVAKTEIKPSYLFTISAKTEIALMQRLKDLSIWLESSKEDLSTISFTLNKGRAHFECRIAIVAASIEELNYLIKTAIAGKFDTSILTSKLNSNRESSLRPVLEKALQATITTLNHSALTPFQYKENLLILASLYAYGQTIDWDTFYAGEKNKRIELPTYPFAKNKFMPSKSQQKHLEKSAEEKSLFYYQPIWQKQPLEQATISSLSPILIFDDDQVIANELTKNSPKINIIHVKPGKSFKTKKNNEYEMNMNKMTEYERLFNHLKKQKMIPGTIIYKTHLMLLNSLTQNAIENCEKDYFNLVQLSKALLKLKLKEKIKLVCLNNNPSEQSIFTQALSGFEKSLHLENNNIICQMIDMQPNVGIVNLLYEANDENIRYDKDNIRWVKDFKPVNLADEYASMPIIKKHGTYLLTGIENTQISAFANFLAKNYKANLILIGKSKPSSELKKFISHLKSQGSEIIHFTSDLSQRKNVENIIGQIKRLQDNLDGVIHHAQTSKKTMIAKMTQPDIKKELSATINSTLFLDHLTKLFALDFFVLSSSTAASFGSVGKSISAYACSFIDAFSHLREEMRNKHERSGRTIVIEWPDQAITTDDLPEDLILNQNEHIAAFMKALSQENTNWLVLKRKMDKSNQADNQTEINTKAINEKSQTLQKPANKLNNSKIDRIRNELKMLMGRFIKVDANNISLDQEWREYGLDSINFISFIGQVNQFYNIETTSEILVKNSCLNQLADYLLEHYNPVPSN